MRATLALAVFGVALVSMPCFRSFHPNARALAKVPQVKVSQMIFSGVRTPSLTNGGGSSSSGTATGKVGQVRTGSPCAHLRRAR